MTAQVRLVGRLGGSLSGLVKERISKAWWQQIEAGLTAQYRRINVSLRKLSSPGQHTDYT